METQIDASQLAGSLPPADLSLWGLFLQADIIVKVVMLILLMASFWSWAIIFEKAMRLKRLNARARQFEESFWAGGSLEELFDPARLQPDYQSKGWNPPGVDRRAIKGHTFGVSLPPADRAALLAFLRSL